MTPAVIAPPFGSAQPEILLALGALGLILYGAWRGERATAAINALALALIAVALIAVLKLPESRTTTLQGSFIADAFAKYMKVITLLGSAAAIVLSADYFRRENIARFEYPILIVLATIGMMVMISANDLIALYLGLELQSLAAYVIASFHRDDARSTEAGLKYFVLGALSSGMLLYGASLVYGFTGTVSFPAMASVLRDNAGIGIILGVVFVAAGVAFKLAAVPFHMWTPDVYEGSPTPVTAFFASAPKAAAMAMAVRVFIGGFPGILEQWQQIIVFLSLTSMALGAFAAIGQRNIKRLMAYSAISNVGYALIGLAAGTPEGVQGVVVYMAIYIAMTLGAFACILGMRRGRAMVEDIDDLAGMARTHPWTAFCFATMLFSLAGIPPLGGFFAKLYVFAAAIQAGLVALAVIGVVLSVIGAYYYIRIVRVMYFDEPGPAFEPLALGPRIVLGLTSALILLFWLPGVPSGILGAADAAARSLF